MHSRQGYGVYWPQLLHHRMLVLQDQEWLQIWRKVLLCASPGWWTAYQKGQKRMVTKVLWPCWRSMDCTIERGNPLFAFTDVTSATDLLCATHQIHDYWVASFRIWSRRGCHQFCGRAQTCRIPSNVQNSRKPLHVMLTFETKILRSEWFAQVNLISVAPTLENLRIGLRRRQSGKSKVPAKQTAKLAKSVLKLKENNKPTFFSLSENRCLPASTLKPEEREFVLDSEASMHMISKKDFNDAEMDTLTKSCSPTIVITANGEVQTHEEATILCQRVGYILVCESPRKHASTIVAWKALRSKADILTSGSTVKNHISLKTGFGYNATRRTSFRSWFQACQRVRLPVLIFQLQWHLQDRRGIILHLPQDRLVHQLRHYQVIVRLEKERIKVKFIHLQCLCQVQMLMIWRGNPSFAVKPITSKVAKPTKNPTKQMKRKPR